jgi:tetratricopeptide (TPR) repeat protein
VCPAQQIPAGLSQTQAALSAPRSTDTPYSHQFTAIQLQLTRATAPEAAVLLARADGLRDKLNNPAVIDQLLASVAADPHQNTLVRDDANYYLSRIALQRGQVQDAEGQLKALGFVRQWAAAGPFGAGNPDSLLSHKFGPEEGYRADCVFKDAAFERRWAELGTATASPWVDLSHVFPGAASTAIFLSTSVYSEAAQEVALRFGSELPHAIYVNGERLYLNPNSSEIAFDQHTAVAQLQPGWNSVVVKLVHTSEKTWRFGLRLTGVHGEELNLASAVHDRNVVAGTPSTVAERQADDLTDMASSVAAVDPKPQNLETLALLENIRHRDSGHDHMEAAARRSPTPERWLHVAELCPNTSCRYQALAFALRFNGAYEPAIVALADYYTARGQKTKARDLLQEALRREPNDFVAKDKLIELYAAAGLTTLALEESNQIATEFPAPLWLKQRLMIRYQQLSVPARANAVATAILKDDFTATAARDILIHAAERRNDTRALIGLYRDASLADSSDPVGQERLAELLAKTNDAAGAVQAYAEAVGRTPFDAVLHQSFAAALVRGGQREQGTRELAIAASLNTQSRQPSAAPAINDSEFMVNAVALAAAYKPSPDDSAVSLADIRVEHLQANGANAVQVQEIVAINTTQAASDYAQQAIRYSPESQNLEVIHARVLKRDGRQIAADDEGENAVSEAAMYYDVRARIFRFAVEPGDVVELEYRLTPSSSTNPYGDYFGDIVVFGSSIPQRMKRLVVIAPESRPLHVVEERMPAGQVSVRNGERIHAWESHNIAALPDEPRGPALTEVAPYVHVSTFGSWQEVGAWYARLVRPQFALDAALRQAADKVIAGKKSDLDKITAIQEFVLHQTHYVAMEFGIYSYKPYPVTQTFERRFGDCKDKASLIVALLRYAGIDAEMALVRTRRLGQMSDDATSLALFNHAIVHVPKYDLWLDGTAEYAGLRELPLDDQGAMALTVSLDGKATLRTIPITRAEDNYTRRVVRVQVHSDGRMDFNGTTYTRGEDAPGLRREYEVAERQRDRVRENLAQVFPTVRVEDVQVTGAADLQRDVEVNFRGTLDTFMGRNAVPLQSSWMPRSFAQSLAVLTERTEDLVLPAPWISEEELHFQLPSSANVDSMPRDTKISTEFGTASLRYERRGRELIVHTSVEFTKLRITPEEYGSFRAFCQQVERAFRTEVKIRLAA